MGGGWCWCSGLCLSESTKRGDPGIQDPEEGFIKCGRFKHQGLMRQPQGLMRQSQGLLRKPLRICCSPQIKLGNNKVLFGT